MTLTNHTRRICELAGHVQGYADTRHYEEAHEALDEIVIKVCKLHRHIDNLQKVNEPFPVPAGG